MFPVQLRGVPTRHDHEAHEDTRPLRAERPTAEESDESQSGESQSGERADEAHAEHEQQQRPLDVQSEQLGEHQRAEDEDPGELVGQRRPPAGRALQSQAGNQN